MTEKNAPPPIPPEVIKAWNRMLDAAVSFEERQEARAKLGMPEAKGDTVRIVRALSPAPASIAAERLSGLVLDTTEAGIRAKLIELGWTPPEWQPIDTAPKDGTAILVLVPYTVPVQTTASWRPYYGTSGAWGLCDAGDNAESADLTFPAPTHWKPLGPNPEAAWAR